MSLTPEEQNHAENLVLFKAEKTLNWLKEEVGYGVVTVAPLTGWYKLSNINYEISVNLHMPDEEDRYLFHFTAINGVSTNKFTAHLKTLEDYNELFSKIFTFMA